MWVVGLEEMKIKWSQIVNKASQIVSKADFRAHISAMGGNGPSWAGGILQWNMGGTHSYCGRVWVMTGWKPPHCLGPGLLNCQTQTRDENIISPLKLWSLEVGGIDITWETFFLLERVRPFPIYLLLPGFVWWLGKVAVRLLARCA